MVAPSLSLNQIVASFASFPQANVATNLSSVVGYNSTASSITFGASYVNNATYFIELIFPGGAINATGTEWHTIIYLLGARDIVWGLGSGAGNYRKWSNAGVRANFRAIDLIFSTSQSTTIPDVGVFDITAVDRIRIEYLSTGTGSHASLAVGFYGVPFYWDEASGMAVIGGDPTTPLSFSALLALRQAYLGNLASTNQVTFVNILAGTNLIQFAAPLVFGSASTTAVLDNHFLLFSFAENNTTPASFTDSNLPTTRYINGFSNLSPQSHTVTPSGIAYSWEEAGTNNDWGRLTIENPTTVELGLSNYTNGLINGATGLSSGGKFVAIEWKNCTNSITYEWRQNSDNSYPDLSGSVFNSPAADYYIDIPSTLNTITFDASEITFTSYVGVTFFRTNVPSGHTVTIQAAAASGITLSNVQQDGPGTTVIQAPQPTLTLTSLVAGSTIRVQNTTDNVELYNLMEATTEWSGSVPGGKGLLIRVRKATGSPEYKPLQTSFVTGISVDQTVVINQELDV